MGNSLYSNINACGVLGARAEVQVSKREFHTHIHLDYVRVEILSCIIKKKFQVELMLQFIQYFFTTYKYISIDLF